MKIGNWLKIWEWTKVTFGEGTLDRLVVFENKYLCSVYLNIWNVVKHDRFHQHAFAAVSFGLKGWYWEQELDEGGNYFTEAGWSTRTLHKAPWIRFIPRTNNHRMLQSSKDAISITITGPWDRMWSETFLNGAKRVLTWGRKEVVRYPNIPVSNDRING